jgi:hypothetical protein
MHDHSPSSLTPQTTPDPDRFRGCLLGLAAGDAVGTTAEFMPRGSFPPITGMQGGRSICAQSR